MTEMIVLSPDSSQSTQDKKLCVFRTQPCPACDKAMGDMPGMRDAVCKNCGFKDPCCE